MRNFLFLLALAALEHTLVFAQTADFAAYDRALSKGFAASRDNKHAEAVAAFKTALAINGDDGQIWLQLGQSAIRANLYDDAIEAGKQVLAKGAFSQNLRATAHFEMACAYTLKGDKNQAWKSLDASLASGFRNLDRIRTDERLKPLHADRRWEILAATKDVAKMSRNDAWRYDLWLLDRELRRIHFAPYKFVAERDRANLVKRIRDGISKWSDETIQTEFMKYAATFGDGHTWVRPSVAPRPRLGLFLFSEGIHVVSAHADHKTLLGSKIVAVEGVPIADLMKKVEPLISHENPQGVKSFTPAFVTNPIYLKGLGIPANLEKIKLDVLLAGGQASTVEIPCFADAAFKPDWATMAPASNMLSFKNRAKPYWFEWLPEHKAMYFQYNSVRNDEAESISAFVNRMFKAIDERKAERMIIDARWNGGGNTFLSQPILEALWARPNLSRGGGLYVIIGRNTYSAAQNFVTDIGRTCSPIYVGEPTGSAPNFIGESIGFSLPHSKMRGSISDLYWQRSWPMDERIWIAPELPAPPSFQSLLLGKDPAMEAIKYNIGLAGPGE